MKQRGEITIFNFFSGTKKVAAFFWPTFAAKQLKLEAALQKGVVRQA